MAQLTKMQQKIYDYIVQAIQDQGYPPSVREIGEAVGLKSPSTVHFHLKHLEELGVIGKQAGKGRALTLTEAPQENQVPIVGNVAAGSPILAQECIEDYLTFDTGGRDGEYFALRVRGESMINAGILPDDLVVVHQQPVAHNGEIVVALLGASWAADHLSEPVTRWIEPRVTQRVEQKIEESHAADAGQMLQAFSFRGSGLQKMLDTVHQRVQQTGETVIRAVAQSIARSVAGTAVYVVVFLILLVLLWLLMKPLNAIVTRLPLISTVNGLGGAALGLVCGGLTLFVAVWAMQRFGWLLTPELIDSTTLLKFFATYTPLGLLAAL